ncbi:hypothetical protein D3C86_1419860 [compost metagenome]
MEHRAVSDFVFPDVPGHWSAVRPAQAAGNERCTGREQSRIAAAMVGAQGRLRRRHAAVRSAAGGFRLAVRLGAASGVRSGVQCLGAGHDLHGACPLADGRAHAVAGGNLPGPGRDLRQPGDSAGTRCTLDDSGVGGGGRGDLLARPAPAKAFGSGVCLAPATGLGAGVSQRAARQRKQPARRCTARCAVTGRRVAVQLLPVA